MITARDLPCFAGEHENQARLWFPKHQPSLLSESVNVLDLQTTRWLQVDNLRGPTTGQTYREVAQDEEGLYMSQKAGGGV